MAEHGFVAVLNHQMDGQALSRKYLSHDKFSRLMCKGSREPNLIYSLILVVALGSISCYVQHSRVMYRWWSHGVKTNLSSAKWPQSWKMLIQKKGPDKIDDEQSNAAADQGGAQGGRLHD